MNGYIFYWVAWLIWIIIVFLKSYKHIHYAIICWLFLLMITLNSYIYLFSFYISIAFIILFIGLIIIYSNGPINFFRLLTTFTLINIYISLNIWQIVAPIWFVLPAIIIIPFMMSMGAIFLSPSYKERFIHILVSVTFGELFYRLVLNSYYLTNEIGTPLFFDYLAVSFLFIMVVYFGYLFLLLLRRMSLYFYQKVFSLKN